MHTHTTDRSTQTTKVDRHTSPSRKPCTYIKRQVQASPNNCVNMRVRACVNGLAACQRVVIHFRAVTTGHQTAQMTFTLSAAARRRRPTPRNEW